LKQFPFYVAFLAICLCYPINASTAQERSFGLGVIIGEPTGISAKLWTSPTNAFDFGLGWSIEGNSFSKNEGEGNGESRLHFHMDYLWHAFNAIKSEERFPIYYGIGGRVNTGGGFSTSVAVRGVIGIAWMPRETPIDIFFELAPALQLSPSTGFVIDAGIGARYFF